MMIWESLIIVSVILVYLFTRNEKKKRKEQERLEEENKKREQERLEREKELEKESKNKEFWYGLSGLETEDELNKVFDKLGYETELTPPSNDEGIV